LLDGSDAETNLMTTNQQMANKARHPTAGAWVSDRSYRSLTASVTLPAIPPLVPRYGQEVRQMLATRRFHAFRRPSGGCA